MLYFTTPDQLQPTPHLPTSCEPWVTWDKIYFFSLMRGGAGDTWPVTRLLHPSSHLLFISAFSSLVFKRTVPPDNSCWNPPTPLSHPSFSYLPLILPAHPSFASNPLIPLSYPYLSSLFYPSLLSLPLIPPSNPYPLIPPHFLLDLSSPNIILYLPCLMNILSKRSSGVQRKYIIWLSGCGRD